MNKFIELHEYLTYVPYDDRVMLIAIDQISLLQGNDKGMTFITLKSGECYEVMESYSKVRNMLKEASECAILID